MPQSNAPHPTACRENWSIQGPFKPPPLGTRPWSHSGGPLASLRKLRPDRQTPKPLNQTPNLPSRPSLLKAGHWCEQAHRPRHSPGSWNGWKEQSRMDACGIPRGGCQDLGSRAARHRRFRSARPCWSGPRDSDACRGPSCPKHFQQLYCPNGRFTRPRGSLSARGR